MVDMGVDENGQNALHHFIASEHNDSSSAEKLMQELLYTDKAQCLRLINEADKNGDSPLHLAVKLKALNFLRVLLKLGADPDLPNNAGLSPQQLIPTEKGLLLRAIFNAAHK